ncbi:MAG: L,D-transpeptidase [Prochlorococcaceae cyanobacterium]
MSRSRRLSCLLPLLLALSQSGFFLAARAEALNPSAAIEPWNDQPEPAVELVLDRRRRQLLVLRHGTEQRRYPVAIGKPGWETPVGRFAVQELVQQPIWVHPASGQQVPPGPANPLGSRWIGFFEDCTPRRGFNGQSQAVVRDCASAGFHGTPQRSSVGRAVSHGCVRLLDEHIRELFELVELGTPVTVLP